MSWENKAKDFASSLGFVFEEWQSASVEKEESSSQQCVFKFQGDFGFVVEFGFEASKSIVSVLGKLIYLFKDWNDNFCFKCGNKVKSF